MHFVLSTDSRRNGRPLVPFRHDHKRDVAVMIGWEEAVRFEQLGDHEVQLIDQRIQGYRRRS
jgi:hypothetical protein